MRIPTEELNGKCLYFEKIKGRVADLALEQDKVVVRSYNRIECPLPNGKPQEQFASVDEFWLWVESKGYTVIPPLVYKLI